MALNFIRPEETPKSQGFDYGEWYEKNKKRLSEKRAQRYRSDAAYREKALERSRAQRQKKPSVPDEGYTLPFTEMAHKLGVTPWVLREWRRKDYFPEPRHRDHRLWFKPEHEALLRRLKDFFDEHGVRVSAAKKKALGEVTALVYANWS